MVVGMADLGVEVVKVSGVIVPADWLVKPVKSFSYCYTLIKLDGAD